MTAAEWIGALRLRKHVEGGYYRETYRSELVLKAEALPPEFAGSRSAATAIYFLLQGTDFSALHRLGADELWHFYAGDPLTLHMLHPGGTYEMCVLGPDIASGQVFQALVPARTWIGATVDRGGSFTLTACTVSPGFEYADFELADCAELCAEYPRHVDLIRRLTRA